MSDSRTRSQLIRLLLFDVDGVLTDGGLYVHEDGTTAKRFDIRDGAGIKMAQHCGYEVGFLSGHSSKSAVRRAESLGVGLCFIGVKDKNEYLDRILAERHLDANQVLYMGDDLIDLGVMRRAGIAATVPEAHPALLRIAHMISTRSGGRGAVRDIIERFLVSVGRFDPASGELRQ